MHTETRAAGALVPLDQLQGVDIRPVPFAVGHFVIRDGRVFSSERGSEHLRERRAVLGDRGYLMLYVASIGRNVAVHAFVAAAFLDARPTPQHQIRHLDGNRLNNSADNLCWGTAQENMDDRARHGTTATGERNGMNTKPERRSTGERNGRAILTETQVYEIRARLAAGDSRADLARSYQVSWNVIDRIAQGLTWARIAEEDARRSAPVADPMRPDDDPPPDAPQGPRGGRRVSTTEGTSAPGPAPTSATQARWEPITTSKGRVLESALAARAHLRALGEYGVRNSYARHRDNALYADLCVEAFAQMRRIDIDTARYQLDQAIPREMGVAA